MALVDPPILPYYQEVLDDLIGFREMSQTFHVIEGTVRNWYVRREITGAPDLVKRLSMGPMFSKSQYIEWWDQYVPRGTHKRLGYLEPEDMERYLGVKG